MTDTKFVALNGLNHITVKLSVPEEKLHGLVLVNCPKGYIIKPVSIFFQKVGGLNPKGQTLDICYGSDEYILTSIPIVKLESWVVNVDVPTIGWRDALPNANLVVQYSSDDEPTEDALVSFDIIYKLIKKL